MNLDAIQNDVRNGTNAGSMKVSRILYITRHLPFGVSEAFIFPEIENHIKSGVTVWIAPLERSTLVHIEKASLLEYTINKPLISFAIVCGMFAEALTNMRRFWSCARLALSSRTLTVKIKNLAVLPKAAWLARWCRAKHIEHIHAHWIAVPSTAGLFASMMSGIPFSITAHRYDIAQGNLINEKCIQARFVRAIDHAGQVEIVEALSPNTPRPLLIHMGVDLPKQSSKFLAGSHTRFKTITGARYSEKKGLKYLVEAIAILHARNVMAEANIFGEGPLEQDIALLAERLGVANLVRRRGAASHEALLHEIASGDYLMAVLPSVDARDGDKEGIPVFLMEAMAAGLPAVTTDNGGIPELAGDGCAAMVEQRNPQAFADAMEKIALDEEYRFELGERGRKRVIELFGAEASAARLRTLFGADQRRSGATQ